MKKLLGFWVFMIYGKRRTYEVYNFILLIIVVGVLLLVATPSVLFKLNWDEKTRKEKILIMFYYFGFR